MNKFNMMAIKSALLALMLIICVVAEDSSSEVETILLNIIHRHGDRTPQHSELVPNDPNDISIFVPPGLGQLTNSGKRRAYALGQTLRKAYDKFLGSYTPASLETLCTRTDRTQMTLLSMLAALYPPEGSTVWNETLNWQPIPYQLADLGDRLLYSTSCPLYLKERTRIANSEEAREQYERFADLAEKITIISGKDVGNIIDLYHFFNLYESEFFYDDAKKINFTQGVELLVQAVNLVYTISSYNDLLIRLNGGILLKKMISDMKAAAAGEIPRERKAYIYSAHETNVAAMIRALGKEIVEPPFYASAVILALVKKDSNYFVQSLYYPSYETKLVNYPIEGCDDLCPIDKFEKLLKSYIPTKAEIECKETDSEF